MGTERLVTENYYFKLLAQAIVKEVPKIHLDMDAIEKRKSDLKVIQYLSKDYGSEESKKKLIQ